MIMEHETDLKRLLCKNMVKSYNKLATSTHKHHPKGQCSSGLISFEKFYMSLT